MELFDWSWHQRRRKMVCVFGSGPGQCGPAALASVARYHGVQANLIEISSWTGSSAQGCNLGSLKAAAGRLGFSASTGLARPGVLDRIPLPAIAHFADPPGGHFVVIYHVSERTVVIADPGQGIMKLRRGDFMSRWSGHLMLLSPSVETPLRDAVQHPLYELLRLALKHRRECAVALILAVLIAALGLAMSYILEVVIDQVLPTSDRRLLFAVSAGMLVIIVMRSVSIAVRQILLARAGLKIEVSLAIDLLKHVFAAPVELVTAALPGEMASRLTDVANIRGAAIGSLQSLAVDGVLAIIAFLGLVTYNTELALLGAVFVIITAAAVPFVTRPIIRANRAARGLAGDAAARLVEFLTSIRAIKSYLAEGYARSCVAGAYCTAKEAGLRASVFSAIAAAAAAMVTGMSYLVVLAIGAELVLAGKTTLGQLMFFYSALGFFLGPLDRIGGSVLSLSDGCVGVERYTDISGLPIEEQAAASGSPISIGAPAVLELKGLWFSYAPGRPILRSIDLALTPGEVLAVVGATGSGKSTLAGVMAGLYRHQRGALHLGDAELDGCDWLCLRRNTAIVFQDAWLVQGTIRDNIALGVPDAAQREIEAAADIACASGFISSLPEAYGYDVGQLGGRLSAGQRQRIALARAVLRNRPILILDEATSNLDIETETQVLEGILSHRRHVSTVLITHRLGSLRYASRIIGMASGRITYEGTHPELLKSCAPYGNMWRANGRRPEEAAPGSTSDSY